MEEEQKLGNMQYLSFFAITVLMGVLSLKIGKNVLKKVPGYTKLVKIFTPRPHPLMIHLHREVGELKQTVLEITRDWTETNRLINEVREQQNNFVLNLKTDLNSMRDSLSETLCSSLRDQTLNSELRSTVLTRLVEDMAKEMAEVRQAVRQKVETLVAKTPTMIVVDDWTQTDVRKRPRDDKGFIVNEHDTVKSVIIAIKRALMEFLKEAQKNLSQEREDMMENVRVIFMQLSDDREEIKKSIAGAYNASSMQTQRCFEQLGMMGRDAISSIAAQSDMTNKTTTSRFQELVVKIKDVSRSLRIVDISVASIKDTLDNIDGQFDDIYRKMELGHQANNEMAERMATAALDFENKSNGLDMKHRQLVELINRVSEAITRFQGFDSTDQMDGDPAVGDLHSLVKMCSKRVQMVMTILEQFPNRVEKPMQQVFRNMEFLTEMVEGRLKNGKRPQEAIEGQPPQGLQQFIGDYVTSDSEFRKPGIMEANIKALIKGQPLNGPDQNMSELFESDSSETSLVTYSTDSVMTIQS